MVKKSRGKMTKRSRRLRKHVRSLKGPQQSIKSFKEGDIVTLHFDSAQDRLHHPRFEGRTGTILEKRGRCYVVGVREGNVIKKVIAFPIHLQRIG